VFVLFELFECFVGYAVLWLFVVSGLYRCVVMLLELSSRVYLFGIDEYGCDVVVRLVYGVCIVFGVSVVAIGFGILFGAVLGGFVGVLCGCYNCWFECFVDFVDIFLVIIVVVILWVIEGEFILFSLVVVVAIVRWAEVVCFVCIEVFQVSVEDYALVVRVLGAFCLWVLWCYLMLNAFGPVVVSSVFGVVLMTSRSKSYSMRKTTLMPKGIAQDRDDDEEKRTPQKTATIQPSREKRTMHESSASRNASTSK
jgi:ABC-type dipeptide/oligopeptide/nickel transport systems, permease components